MGDLSNSVNVEEGEESSKSYSSGVLPLPDLPPSNQTQPPPLSRKVKLLTCAAVFYGNIGLALVCHVHGPALTSFQKKYKTNDETISIVFSLMTAGIASGALLSCFLFRWVNRQLATIFLFGLMGLFMFIIPFCPNLTIFFVVSTLMGFFGGFYSAAQFTWILEMMQSECPPYVIAEHFFYAFGIIVSSLLLAPFLDKNEAKEGILGGAVVAPENVTPNYTYTLVGHHVILKDKTDLVTLDDIEEEEGNKLIIPFTIMAIILELSMVFQLILFIFFRYHAPPPEEKEEAEVKEEINQINYRRMSVVSTDVGVYDRSKRRGSVTSGGSGGNRDRRGSSVSTGSTGSTTPRRDLTISVGSTTVGNSHRRDFTTSGQSEDSKVASNNDEEPGPYWKRIMLIGYIGIFCGSFKGMEDNVVAFLPKYAQNGPLHISESDSAYILSAMSLAYTVARFIGIFIVYKVPPRAVLLCNMALTIVCNILLMTWAQDNKDWLWVTSVLFGIGFSTAYGCFSAWLERFLHVTDAVGSFVLLYGAGIAALYPILIGKYIEKYPIILGYTGWISIGICTTVIILSEIQTRWDKRRY